MNRPAKVLVTTILIVLLAALVDWDDLWLNLQRLQWPATLIAFCAYGVQFFTSGWKWQSALAVLGVRLPAGFLIRVYCIAHFVGQFLPTAIGGDAYRIYRTMPLTQPRSRAISAIVIERLVGFAILLFIGGIGALALKHERLIAETYVVILAFGIVAALLVALMMRTDGFRWVGSRLQALKGFQALAEDYRQLKATDWRWLSFLGLSLLFQIISIGILYVLFQGIGAHITWAECTLIAAVAGAATVLPISINGIGVVESSLAGTAVALGVNYEDALAVAVLARLLVMPLSLVCGLIYMMEPKRNLETVST